MSLNVSRKRRGRVSLFVIHEEPKCLHLPKKRQKHLDRCFTYGSPIKPTYRKNDRCKCGARASFPKKLAVPLKDFCSSVTFCCNRSSCVSCKLHQHRMLVC